MRFLCVLSLLASAGVAVAAPPPGTALGTPAPSPKSATGRALAFDAATRFLDGLVAAAKRDRADLIVDVFTSYGDAELEDPNRGVTVEMLLDLVKNDDLAKDVRQRAAEAICAPRLILHDPALSQDGGKGIKRKKAEFSQKVNKLLLDNDVFVRALAKQILESLWPGWGGRFKEIKACNPRDRNSCVEANRAWERAFRQ